ncbi:heterokaryon incompatibility protein-domain-containing protein [Bisporella sp. PMI_857]|nr:heterokaryon incompatibility protein-domain-containing protein [Bisporella sp. PMI_857]
MDRMELDPIVETALYKPLEQNQIRLLAIEPGPQHAPVATRLHLVYVNSLPQYDGVCYVWGDSSDTVSIFCDGMSVNITRSLCWALARLRLSDRIRLVWADALCINQNDKEERSRQVAVMSHIYRGTRCVMACMGDSLYGDEANVASLLEDYGPMISDPSKATQLSLYLQSNLFSLDKDPRWKSLGLLLSRPWFERAWVLQEVGLARNPIIVYGSVEFGYRRLMEVSTWISRNARGLAARAGIAALLIHMNWTDWSPSLKGQLAAQQIKFVDILDHASLQTCSDPRDHIYAFLGHPLAEDCGIVPDYTKDKLQVYHDASIKILKDAGIRALSMVEHDKDTISENFPSWVIRWDIGYVINNIYSHPDRLYQASANLSTNMRINGNTLQLSGICVDTIQSVYSIHLYPDSTRLYFTDRHRNGQATLFDLISYLENPELKYAYSCEKWQALIETLWAGTFRMKHSQGSQSVWSEYQTWLHAAGHNLRIRKAAPITDGALKFSIDMVSHSEGRAFFLTTHGFYGIGSRVIEQGDVCCVLYGSRVPFIVRPRPIESLGQYRFLGESYVHGIMQGEAVEMCQRGILKEEVLSIY